MVRVNTTRAPAVAATAGWHPVTAADAQGGEAAIASLRAPAGKVFANLTPSEAVAYLLEASAKQLPPSSTDVQAMVSGDELHVRAVVPLRDLGAAQALGPLASMLGQRDTVQLAGRVDLVRAGLAQLHVSQLRIGSLDLPSATIPRLIKQIRHTSPPGLAPDALALPLPPYVGDIRIANGRVTVYKNVQ